MPDLKKMLTLEALSEALPSWLKRSTKPEYNADEIDSTLTTNQFVTASDKDNWNAKGTYSKPSGGIPKSDLSSIVQTSLENADSALQSETDPTVPSWAKQSNKPSYTQDEVADGSTYKRVTQNEKDAWSGKQNALTTTQMQAVNSGITSEKVGQISTNQTNILYSLNTGVKNELDNLGITSYVRQGVTFTFNKDGSVQIKGTATGGSVTFYYFTNEYRYIPNIYKGHVLSGVTSGGEQTYGLLIQYSNNGTSWATQAMCKTAPITVDSGYNYVNFCIIVFSGQTVDTTIYPMLCTPEAWAQSQDFQPPAKPNSDLTYLEAEDRAALAEVVDSGAKNLFDFSSATFTTHSTTTYTKTASAITIETTGVYGRVVTPLTLKKGTYTLSTKISNFSSTNAVINVSSDTIATDSIYGYVNITGNGDYKLDFTLSNDTTVYIALVPRNTGSATSTTEKFTASDIMVSTKAAFCLSNKFVPYRVPINGVFWAEKYEARSTTLVSTGIKFTASKQTIYRITATAQYGNSKPTQLVIKKKLIPSESEGTFVAVSSDTNSQSLTATGIMTLGVGGYFEVYAAYDGTTSNRVYAIVEEVVL
jgi:hypothetical protein